MIDRQAVSTAPSDHFRRKRLVETAGERLRSAPLGPWARAAARRIYHGALMIGSRGRGLSCTLPRGEVVRVLPEYRYLSWNRAEYDAFRAAVPQGATALDVGANVGAYALLLGQWVGAGGRVYAFEPAPDVVAGLRRHVRLNGLDAVVHPIAAAVADTEGDAELLVSGTAGASRLANRPNAGARVTVESVTIDGFCARHDIAPDFLKIDVEGLELAALRGARGTIRSRPDLALFVELHPSIWPDLGVTRADMLAEFASQGLEPEPLTPGSDPWALEGVAVRLRRR